MQERIAIKVSTGELYHCGPGEAFERMEKVGNIYHLTGRAGRLEINGRYIVSVRRCTHPTACPGFRPMKEVLCTRG